MKSHERESFLKSFLIFFISLEVLVVVIAFLVYEDKKQSLQHNILLEMKNYNYTLQGDKFSADIVPALPGDKRYTLLEDNLTLYSLFDIDGVDDTLLKVSFLKKRYNEALRESMFDEAVIFFFVTIVIMVYALFFSYYSLRPLSKAYSLLEEFLKDIVHDLNTPVTSILLNTRMLRKKVDETYLERIDNSAKTIHSLHENLQNYLHSMPFAFETLDVAAIVTQRVEYYQSLYPLLTFKKEIQPVKMHTNKSALTRIVDNIISNACKYNTQNGEVQVTLTHTGLVIEDTGVGIKDVSKIFDRFYKESSRGMGIGLHIVQKLCKEMNIGIEVSSGTQGTKFVLEFDNA